MKDLTPGKLFGTIVLGIFSVVLIFLLTTWAADLVSMADSFAVFGGIALFALVVAGVGALVWFFVSRILKEIS